LFNEGKFGKLSKKQDSAMKVIKDESTRLSGLINDILDLARLEEKRMKLNIADFDLYSFFKENIYYSLANKKGLQIINKVKPGFVISVDSDKFTRALINLISNAIKYTDKGSITLSAKRNKHIEITIKDTGKGISEQELKKIFDKFYQVEHYMTRKERGTGLGLAIANEIVRLHKGKITVKSKLGQGSEFTIIIPKHIQ
jgi:signal transduction histidine kinase